MSETQANPPQGPDLNRYPDCDAMRELVRTGGKGSTRDELNQAQQFVYDAWEEIDRSRRFALARKALALSPLCADAWVVLFDLRNLSSAVRLEYLTRAVCAGRLAIGERRFVEDKGDFWLILETRPYMRARHALADELWFSGAFETAIAHLREMLELNPNDNQGLRYVLLSRLISMEDDAAAARLLGELRDEVSTFLEFTRVLLAFRQRGDSEMSRASVARATLSNRHVARYLNDPKLLHALSDHYSPGHENEAAWYAQELGIAWRKTPGAVEWLVDQMAKEPAQNRDGDTLH